MTLEEAATDYLQRLPPAAAVSVGVALYALDGLGAEHRATLTQTEGNEREQLYIATSLGLATVVVEFHDYNRDSWTVTATLCGWASVTGLRLEFVERGPHQDVAWAFRVEQPEIEVWDLRGDEKRAFAAACLKELAPRR
jgi:hypothetical protein